MSIEERRGALVAVIENAYGGQEVLRLADAYALAVLEECQKQSDKMALGETDHDPGCPMCLGLNALRGRILALGHREAAERERREEAKGR